MPFLKGLPHENTEESWAYVSLSLPYLMKVKAFCDAHFTSRADLEYWLEEKECKNDPNKEHTDRQSMQQKNKATTLPSFHLMQIAVTKFFVVCGIKKKVKQ